MEDKQQQMIALIDETLEYYRTHPRAISTDKKSCLYLTPDGNKCAFARLLNDDDLQKAHKEYEGRNASEMIRVLGLEMSFHEYFYDEVQMIHDNPEYWEGNIFTQKGNRFVEKLKRNVIDGLYN